MIYKMYTHIYNICHDVSIGEEGGTREDDVWDIKVETIWEEK